MAQWRHEQRKRRKDRICPARADCDGPRRASRSRPRSAGDLGGHLTYPVRELVLCHLLHKRDGIEGLRPEHAGAFPEAMLDQVPTDDSAKGGLRDNRMAAPTLHALLVVG